MDDSQVFTFASTFYFERLLYASDDATYRSALLKHLPPDWVTRRSDVWLEVHPHLNNMPSQGFKLHLSAQPDNAISLIALVAPYLVERSISFKIIASSTLHRLVNSKRYARPACGKFFTIYPPTHESFLQLASDLTSLTAQFSGPYILSDERIGDNGIVFYRYGGFRQLKRLRRDGTSELLIKNSSGQLTVDERLPYFNLPDGINDPFPDQLSSPATSPLLNSRYEIREALVFSATGGVYKGVDTHTGADVVVKEARPYILSLPSAVVTRLATESLKHEADVMLKLQHLDCVPRFVEQFTEWEHHFLVESFEHGTPLVSLRAQTDFIILERMSDALELRRSCSVWRDVAEKLIAAVMLVHEAGLVVGDISPANVLRDPDTGRVVLIDMEGAHIVGAGSDANPFSVKWAFPGFRKYGGDTKTLQFEDDFFAIGMTLYNLICPVHNLFEFAPQIDQMAFLEHFVDGGLPFEMNRIISLLCAGDVNAALSVIRAFDPATSITEATVAKRDQLIQRDNVADNYAFAESCGRIASDIRARTDVTRSDRLWPADAMVFQTNPLGLAHGACGIACFLNQLSGRLDEDVLTWFEQQSINSQLYPAGWAAGMGGVAWAFADLGWHDRAKEVMRQAPSCPSAFSSPDFHDGIAGWGTAALAVAGITDSAEMLEIASQASTYLVKTFIRTKEVSHWPLRNEATVHLGFGLGNSGIATFLLRMWQRTKKEQVLQVAIEAMESELRHGRESGDSLLWGPTADSTVTSPYWLRGSGGVAAALIRFYSVLGDERYLKLALRASKPATSFFSVAPHLFEGLAAMGDTLLDMYWVTGDSAFLQEARLKAHQIMLYAIQTESGIIFPGRFLFRASCDYATGSAGIGTFLMRLQNLGPRRFIDPF